MGVACEKGVAVGGVSRFVSESDFQCFSETCLAVLQTKDIQKWYACVCEGVFLVVTMTESEASWYLISKCQ
jgi:hypothetical protein